MIVKANLREAVRSLRSAKQRTLLALIGIVIGIGSVIAMVSVGTIAQHEALRQFKELGTDVLLVEKDYAAEAAGEGAPGFRLPVVLGLAQQLPALVAVSPQTQGGGGDAFFQGKPIERAQLLGVSEDFLALNKLQLAEGRGVSALDTYSRYVVVGHEIARQMQQHTGTSPLGRTLRLGEQLFTVMGTLAPASQGGLRRFDPNTVVLVHASTALRLPGCEIALVQARVRPGISNAQAGAQIQAYFSRLPGGLMVRISSPEDLIAQMEKQMQMFTLLLGAIGSISLVVGGVGVMNVMLVSVSERRKEIGIRRALGARRGDIRGQFLIESVILSLIGGLLGVVLGVGTAAVVCHFAQWQFLWSLSSVVLGVGVSTLVGVFFGFYPARQASQLDPIVALRGH